ncbi:cytochrome P450 4V2-like [Babylonia areolata]|uniref:cytochrome P450 4V2-like n=1 Tax=Babylonia areolata TaxID=304850 RepID=UPI003FD4C6CC
MSAVLVLVGVVSVVCACIWFLQTARLRRLINQIPGPPSVPVLGNAHQMISGPEWYKRVMEWGRTYQQEGIFKLWLMTKPVVGVATAEKAEFLLNSSKHIDKASEYDFLHVWLGTGLLTSTGDKWRSRRKMLTPTFHFRILHDFLEVFNQQSQVLVRKLQGHVQHGPFNVFQDIALCALDIICETAMGQHVSAQTKDSEYVRAVYRMCGLLEHRMRAPWYWNKAMYDLFGPGKEHDRCLKTLHEFTVKVIKERMNNFNSKRAAAMLSDATAVNGGDDDKRANSVEGSKGEKKGEEREVEGVSRKVRLAFLDMLLYMSDNGRALSLGDIQEEVDTFMFEGHDTTAAAMNWCTYLVASDDKVQDKVHEELDRVFGDSDRMPTMDDLKELKYLECCIKEALRLYPSVPYFGRTTTEEAKIGPYTLPEGVTAVIFTSCIHRDPRSFPDPDRFDPDRFLPENSSRRHPYAYIPFSAGLRNCIGQKFALLEEKSVLSAIFRHFRVKACQKRDELLPVGELILRPHKGILIELTAR